jgi:hypothetical protein
MDEETRLLRSSEARQNSFVLPVAVSNRLDRLVERAEQQGIQTSRKDLVAALILTAPEDPPLLLELSLRYGKATTRDAALDGEPETIVLHLVRPRPGRRPRAGR